MKVLVVDDDRIARVFIAESLVAAGYKVVTAADGKAALRIIQSENIPIVISDWQMPVMDGIKLCKAAKQLKSKNGNSYFILITSLSNRENIHEGLTAGADDYIKKPYDAVELVLRTKIGERTIKLETKEMTSRVLASIISLRSRETSQHIDRVKQFSEILARELASQNEFRREIDSQFVELIIQASWLHDLGKVGLPDKILGKKGPLNSKERAIIEAHPSLGAKIIDETIESSHPSPFLLMARDIIISSHEWFDGTGYPFGIRGEDIPLAGRIVALANVYDALVSQRAYKDAVSHEQALTEIVALSGRQFDPRIVDSFLAIEHLFKMVNHEKRIACEDQASPNPLESFPLDLQVAK